jgi:DNA-directed RNA polymerase alpha subunit
MRRLQRREEMQKKVEIVQEKAKPVNLTVDGMSLGTRAEKALLEADVTTVGDILKLLESGDDALLALPGIGQKALIDIKRFLRAEGLIE